MIRAIVRNTNEVLSVSIPIEFAEVSKLIFIGKPMHLGWKFGDSLYNTLSRQEQNEILEAGKKVYQT